MVPSTISASPETALTLINQERFNKPICYRDYHFPLDLAYINKSNQSHPNVGMLGVKVVMIFPPLLVLDLMFGPTN